MKITDTCTFLEGSNKKLPNKNHSRFS